jgi:hypothetical protein
MPGSSFGDVLARLWPNGDRKIAGLRAGTIETAGDVFQRYGGTLRRQSAGAWASHAEIDRCLPSDMADVCQTVALRARFFLRGSRGLGDFINRLVQFVLRFG